MYYIYIIQCNSGALYTGITTDIERRIKEHLGIIKKGAKYTRANPPKALEALWLCESRSNALRIEARIKRLSRLKKLELIQDKTYTFADICSCERIDESEININISER